MLTSRDLVKWDHHNIDFSALKYPTGAKDAGGVEIPWSEVGCVWAPELVWDEDAGCFLMHFTVRFGNGRNLIYAAHMNKECTNLAEAPFEIFSGPRDAKGELKYNVIDSDIVRDDAGLWHLFYVAHDRGASIRHVTSKSIKGPWAAAPYNDGERRGHEAPNCWRRPDGTWVVMWDNYSRKPHNFGFVETKDFVEWKPIGYFDDKDGVMKRSGFAEQKHGGVTKVPAELVTSLEESFAK